MFNINEGIFYFVTLDARSTIIIIVYICLFIIITIGINLLMPNVNYSGRTAPLTSKVAFYIFIQQI